MPTPNGGIWHRAVTDAGPSHPAKTQAITATASAKDRAVPSKKYRAARLRVMGRSLGVVGAIASYNAARSEAR